MAKMKSNELTQMIRSLVRSEIREVVTQTINEILSERYLKEVAKRVVAENSARPRGVGPSISILDGEQDSEEAETTPEVLQNSDKGIYHKHPSIKEKIASPDLSIFFEGTKPLDVVEAEREVKIPEGGNELTQRWERLAAATDAALDSKRPIQETPEMAMRRIQQLREQLDRKA